MTAEQPALPADWGESRKRERHVWDTLGELRSGDYRHVRHIPLSERYRDDCR